jgi:hypothetical protein
VADEAPLVDSGAGLVPQGDGWFVVNVADAPWLRNDSFGARTSFEVGGRLARELPDLERHPFPDLGISVYVLPPEDRARCTTPSRRRRASSCSRASAF